MLRRLLRGTCWAVCLVAGALVLGGCRGPAEIRVENRSAYDFRQVVIAGQPFGDLAAGTTSSYRSVALKLRYAAIELTAGGQRVTGQTLNLGGRRFTYAIDVLDLDAGHLAIDVVRD